MPHPHSPNLSFEVRFERSGDRGSRWYLFLLRIGLKALRWKSAFKISRKKVYARRGSPLCLGFTRLSLSSTLLASFDREGLSRNGVRILPHSLIYVDRQHQPRDPPWTKPQLFCPVHEHLRCPGSLHRNLPHQPLQFHPSVLDVLMPFALLALH